MGGRLDICFDAAHLPVSYWDCSCKNVSMIEIHNAGNKQNYRYSTIGFHFFDET